MHKAQGYAAITVERPADVILDRGQRLRLDREGIHEIDTFTCVHCNSVRHVPVKQAETFFCRNCMARICEGCADHPCIPFLKKVEAQEERAYRLRAYGGA